MGDSERVMAGAQGSGRMAEGETVQGRTGQPASSKRRDVITHACESAVMHACATNTIARMSSGHRTMGVPYAQGTLPFG